MTARLRCATGSERARLGGSARYRRSIAGRLNAGRLISDQLISDRLIADRLISDRLIAGVSRR